MGRQQVHSQLRLPRYFESLAPPHTHDAGYERVRDLSDASVIGADILIEQCAVIGDLGLQGDEQISQVDVNLAGSEPGIVVRGFENCLQRRGQLQISVSFFADSGCARAGIVGIGEKLLRFDGQIVAGKREEFENLLVALFQQIVESYAEEIVLIAEASESTIEHRAVNQNGGCEDEQNEAGRDAAIHGVRG